MSLLFYIVIIAAAAISLLFIEAMKVRVIFDTETSDVHMSMFWLEPVFKALVSIEEGKTVMTVYLFGKKLKKRQILNRVNSGGGGRGMNLMKMADPRDVKIDAHYGFSSPYVTGIACGAINAASQFVNIESLSNNPDFMPENDYIYIDANAKVNIGSTLLKILGHHSRA